MGRTKLFSLAVELTAACNQKCDYCYNEWREDDGARVATGGRDKLLGRLTRLLDTFDVGGVTLTGGEPFACRDLFGVLDLLSARGVPAHLISNGGLVTPELARRLARYSVRYVQITLNGPTAELHQAHVGGEHFEATLRGIRALSGAGVSVVGCIVLTRKNSHATAEILELFRSLGVRHVALSRFSPAGYAARHAAALLPSRNDLLTAFEQAAPFARTTAAGGAMTLKVTMPVPPCAVEVERFPELAFGTCAIGTAYQEFALGPNGRLRHCTLHGKGIGGEVDILDPGVDLEALVASSEVTTYKRQLPEFCQGCVHAATCGGGCGAAAEWVLGSRRHADPFVMQHVDDAFAERLERERRPGRTHLEVVF